MINDEWALDLMDQIDVLRYKINQLDISDYKQYTKMEEGYLSQIQPLIEKFFSKYYIDELVDYTENLAMELMDEHYLGGKISTVQTLLVEAARRSANNGQHPPESIMRARELGCMYIDKTEKGNKDKKHIELIFNNKEDVKLLQQMEEALQKEKLNLRNKAITGKPLYDKDYFKEYLNLIKQIEEKYYVDGDIDHWGTISKFWYKFSTVDKFHKEIIREQKKRGKRKRQPKKLVEKAKSLNLIKA